jgi:hypothetical protein
MRASQAQLGVHQKLLSLRDPDEGKAGGMSRGKPEDDWDYGRLSHVAASSRHTCRHPGKADAKCLKPVWQALSASNNTAQPELGSDDPLEELLTR